MMTRVKTGKEENLEGKGEDRGCGEERGQRVGRRGTWKGIKRGQARGGGGGDIRKLQRGLVELEI